MKLFKMYFIGVLFITSFFACAPTTQHHVTIAWDAAKQKEGSAPIPLNQELRYVVYIDHDQDSTHVDSVVLTDPPINNTSIEINRHYYIGVQSVYYDVKKKKIVPGSESEIAWSSSKEATKNGPFSVEIMK